MSDTAVFDRTRAGEPCRFRKLQHRKEARKLKRYDFDPDVVRPPRKLFDPTAKYRKPYLAK